MSQRFYSLATVGNEADVYIFGDIVVPGWEWYDSDTSGFSLINEIKDLDVETINVHINSYGGHVSEGLAIYNALKNHKAKIITYDDGFACSAASVVFMAGDERIMNNASLLMIHNAWSYAAGDSNQLRKEADILETITQASINAYMTKISISEEELKTMMDSEKWILPSEALEWGFATSIMGDTPQTSKASQNARKQLYSMIRGSLDGGEAAKERKEETPPAESIEKPKENKLQKMLAAVIR